MKPATFKILFFITGILVFSSCKRSNVFGDITPNTERPIIEFSDPHGFKSIAVDYGTNYIDIDATEIRFMIRTYVTQNATAKIIIDPGVVYDYNDNNQTSYNVVPASLYSLVDNQFTLTATERSKPVRIHIKPSDIANGQNAIGISIAEVDGGEVSRIAGSLVVAISVKNKYDGRYTLKGQFYHPSASPDYAWYTIDVDMITTGPNSVKMFALDPYNFYVHPWVSGGSFTSFAGQEPEYTINPNTNKVTVQNTAAGAVTFYSMGNSFNPTPPNNVYNSRYEEMPSLPALTPKTIYACFGYNLSTSGNFIAGSSRMWIDTLIYTGPR